MTEEVATLFWNTARLRRTLAAIVLGLAIAAIIGSQRDARFQTMLLRGDFPGFYAPAVIIATGQGVHLYDRALQAQIENKFWPSMHGHVLVSVYPAFLPAALQPLAALKPVAAKWFFAVLCFGGLLLTSLLGFDSYTRRSISVSAVTVLLTVFPPLLISLVGGQNTGLTLGFVSVVAWALRKESKASNIIGGVALGLLLYKPQFGLPLVVPFIMWREWRTLTAFFATAIFLLFLPAPWTGINWLSPWLEATTAFAPENFLVNGSRIVSPLAASVNALSGNDGYVLGILI